MKKTIKFFKNKIPKNCSVKDAIEIIRSYKITCEDMQKEFYQYYGNYGKNSIEKSVEKFLIEINR